MHKDLIYKMIFKENRGVFISFLLMTSIFIIISFLIVFLLNGYQGFVLKNLVFGNFHINIKKSDGLLFDSEEKAEIGKKIRSILPDSEVVFYSSSQALLKKDSKYTGAVVYSFDDYNVKESSLKKIGFNDLSSGEIVVGKGIAHLLDLKVGDHITVNGLEEKIDLRVKHIFRTGIYDIDYSTVFIDPESFSILNILPEGYSDIGVFLKDISEINNVKKILLNAIDTGKRFKITDIYEDNRLFQGAINMEKLITTIISNMLMLMFFFVTGLFTLSRLNTFRREFSYLIISGIKMKNISNVVWKIMAKGFLTIFIISTSLSYLLCKLLNGNISVPEEIYYVDSLYFKFDHNYVIVYLLMFSLFTFLLKFITEKYFLSLIPDEEIRSN